MKPDMKDRERATDLIHRYDLDKRLPPSHVPIVHGGCMHLMAVVRAEERAEAETRVVAWLRGIGYGSLADSVAAGEHHEEGT